MILSTHVNLASNQAAASSDDPLRPAQDLCAAGQLSAGLAEFARLVANTNLSPAVRSLAQLSLAQAWRREKEWQAAETEYAKVIQMTDAPAHHRWEAEQQILKLRQRTAGRRSPDRATANAPSPSQPKPSLQLYVSPRGSDANPGTKTRPFATLERARDEIRQLRRRNQPLLGGVAVIIQNGQYPVRDTFELGAEDSGSAESPITYRAASGATPVFSGGMRLTTFDLVRDEAILRQLPAEARGKVYQTDLRSHGITSVPPVRVGGFASGAGFRSHPALELFFNGEAMPLSRWPNQGFIKVVEARGEAAASGQSPAGAKTSIITYEGNRPDRWVKDPDIVLYGYWFYGWADSYERIDRLDLAKKEIFLAPPFHGYGYRRGQPFKAMNLLSEIDEPGEWYLDRRSLNLFFYPPSDPARATVEISLLAKPLVELTNVSWVTFEGLTWELGCTDGVRASGGNHCRLAGCTIRRLGGNGAEFKDGTAHGVLSCDLYSLGRGGLVMSGGDRQTLTPGRHFVENCHIHQLSRLDRTYTPAVLLEGVGHRLAHNFFHDIRSSALRIEGNDHTIEYNEFARVVLESDDQGGVDMFGNPTYRGNVYRHNYFHHIGNWRHPAQEPECGQAGIRLDDMISGTLIYGNIFRRCAAGKLGFGGVQIHGGKDNILDNNLFYECASAVSFSPWGKATWRERTAEVLRRQPIDRPLYLTRYPSLDRLDEDLNVNHLWRNLVVNCDEFLRRNADGARLLGNCVATNRLAFPKASRGIFDFTDATALLNHASFQPLPFEQMGLYRDAYRRKLPTQLLANIRAAQ